MTIVKVSAIGPFSFNIIVKTNKQLKLSANPLRFSLKIIFDAQVNNGDKMFAV